jgi:uncharacterized membrane protein YbhN (UPF0104 family)
VEPAPDETAAEPAAPGSPTDSADVERRLDQVVRRVRRELGRTVSAARTLHPIDAIYVCGLEVPGRAETLASTVGNVADGNRSIGDARLAAGFLLASLLYWGCNAAGVLLLGVGCGLPMSLGHAAAVMGVLAIGILLPTGPGLFGNFQLAVSAALRLYFAESLVGAQGAVFIFLLYALQSSVMVVAGIVPLYALNLRMADLLTLPAEPPGAG